MAYVDEWMARNCTLIDCSNSMDQAIPLFMKWKEQFRDAQEQPLFQRFRTFLFSSVPMSGLLKI